MAPCHLGGSMLRLCRAGQGGLAIVLWGLYHYDIVDREPFG